MLFLFSLPSIGLISFLLQHMATNSVCFRLVSMPFFGLTPFLLEETENLATITPCVNALLRAYSISTMFQAVLWHMGMYGVNALLRAYSISTES